MSVKRRASNGREESERVFEVWGNEKGVKETKRRVYLSTKEVSGQKELKKKEEEGVSKVP